MVEKRLQPDFLAGKSIWVSGVKRPDEVEAAELEIEPEIPDTVPDEFVEHTWPSAT